MSDVDVKTIIVETDNTPTVIKVGEQGPAGTVDTSQVIGLIVALGGL